MIGSEGALGVITEAWLRLQDRPTFRAGAALAFDDFLAGARAVRAIAQAGLYPSQPAPGRRRGVPRQRRQRRPPCAAGAGVRSPPITRSTPGRRARSRWSGTTAGACCRTIARRRPGAPPSSACRTRARSRCRPGSSPTPSRPRSPGTASRPSTPRSRPRPSRRSARRPAGRAWSPAASPTSIPDGPAPYFTFHALGRPGALLEPWRHIKQAASDALLAGGGTITHHHAVGRDHMPWYQQQRPALFGAALAAAKAALDPAGILNPGVLVPAPAG